MDFADGMSLRDISQTERQPPCPPSANVPGLTKSEARAWDAVETYRLANPDVGLCKILGITNSSSANYYKARVKAIASNGEAMRDMGHRRKGVDGYSDSIRPNDPIVKNMPLGPINPKEPRVLPKRLDPDEHARMQREMYKASENLPDDDDETHMKLHAEMRADPLYKTFVGIYGNSAREALNSVLTQLEGMDVKTQRRILQAALVFVGEE